MVDSIAASGARVLGDLEALATVPAPKAARGAGLHAQAAAALAAWPEIDSASALGVLLTATSSRREDVGSAAWPDAAVSVADQPVADPAGREADRISTGAVLGVVQMRFRTLVGTVLGAVRAWLPPGSASRSSSIHSTDVEVE